jgi:hypothetical protein
MSDTFRTLNATGINDVAQLLSRVVDVGIGPRQAEELIDELSQLLWAVSNLDPDVERTLKHSGYIADFVARSAE